MGKMPKTGEKKDYHLKLDLDSDELYNAFQTIKKTEGIRSNTDVLRNLILRRAKEIERGSEFSYLEELISVILDKREKEKKEKD